MLGLKMTTRGACADTTEMVKQIVKLLLSNQMTRRKKTVTMEETMIMKMLLPWKTLLNNSTESGRDLIGMNKKLQGHSIK